MFDHDTLYKVLDSHFVNHLVRDGESDREGENGDGKPAPDMPGCTLDDLLDELDDVLAQLQGEYSRLDNAPTAISFGFIDGVMAQSNGTYSDYEDAYVEDMANEGFSSLDAAIDKFSGSFEGDRDWGEAAKGYVRHVIGIAGADVPGADDEIWAAQAKGFVFGADAAGDYEWKVVQDPSGNVLVTDEDELEEFSARQMEGAMSGRGLFGRITDMLGIDLGELESALGEIEGDGQDVSPDGDGTG